MQGKSGTQVSPKLDITPATPADGPYLVEAFERSLAPYYDGDHAAHAKRVLRTHLGGGKDDRGLLSSRQLLLVLRDGGQRRGILNLVFKHQSTCKISPLILFPGDQDRRGLGRALVGTAEREARKAGARNLYCTVTEKNHSALTFFLELGFAICGAAHEQYKSGETEILLRKSLAPSSSTLGPENIISVSQVRDDFAWDEVKKLISGSLTEILFGVNDTWLESMYQNALHQDTSPEVEGRRVWVYSAQDRTGCYRAGAIVTSKKGGALKVMPVAASDIAAFRALIFDLPTLLFGCGRKAYLQHAPSANEVIALQESPWQLEGLLPDAYRPGVTTQQWGCPLNGTSPVRSLRIQDRYLSLIRNGQKKLEIRVGYEHIKKIRRGDEIRLVSNSRSEQVIRRVRDVRHYVSLDQMAASEDIDQILPGLGPAEALRRLHEIYPPDKERYGVIVLDLA